MLEVVRQFLTIDYFHRKFNFKLDFDGYEYKPIDYRISTGNLGFNDLLNSDIKFQIASGSPNYELVGIGIYPLSGLQTEYFFAFNDGEVSRDKFNNKIYTHKITSNDLGIKQSFREIFFN